MGNLVKGLFYKEKKENAPDFVIGSLSAKRKDLIAFLSEEKDEWVNMQILMSRAGKPYIAIDDWKPKDKDQADAIQGEEHIKKIVSDTDNSLPF